MGKIVFDNFNLGGIADSLHSGPPHTMAAIVGFDVHSSPGVVKVAQKMTKESGSTVDAFCEVSVACSDGNSYWFSKTSGKIWKRTSAGVWSLVYTTVPGAGTAGCTGAYEYNGYIYWATSARLHRIAVSNASSWTSPTLNWQTFTDTSAAYHPMIDVNGILYIGDGYQVDQVEGTTYSDNALDLPTEYDITCFGRYGTSLLIGTIIADNVNVARVFVWNTWSVSWSQDAIAPESGVNAFLQMDNNILVSVGEAGNLYAFTGQTLNLYRRVPGSYSPTSTGFTRPNAVANYRGSLVFGFTASAGTPAPTAAYELGRHTNGYPIIMTTPYPISTGNLTSADIGCIMVLGNDLFMSWYDASSGTYGVDKLDWSNKCTVAYMETMIQRPDRTELSNFCEFEADYYDLPVGTSITLKYKAAGDTSWTALSTTVDSIHRKVSTVSTISSPTMQLRYEPTVSSNSGPELEDIVLRITD